MSEKPKQIVTDFLVYGGTEAGIFAAVQAARSGLNVVLVSETAYLFGFFPSLGALETHYSGCRSPLSSEVRKKIIDHYRLHFGENSVRYQQCVSLEENNPMVTFEPHVAEKVLHELLIAEPKLTLIAPFQCTHIQTEAGRIATIIGTCDEEELEFYSTLYADCSYTGDLSAAAGAQYTIGREPKAQYNEPHAGRIFTRWRQGRYPLSSLNGKLKVLPTWSTTDPLTESTGEGDDCIQDYSYRICLSNDPDNRLLPTKPAGYKRETFAPLLLSPNEKAKLRLPFHHRWLTQTIEEMARSDHLFHGHALPGNKRSWNATNLTGAGKDYAKADAGRRKAIENQHKSHALGLLYFLQNDEDVSENIRKEARKWGLAKDEFKDSSNLPPSMYVREARRFVGDYVYREQDCLRVEGLDRAPIHRDGIAFTEFALDSLPCSTERINGSLPDGQFFEKDKSLPGSLPWRCLIPQNFLNLLTPTCPSVTHCAWGTVRQTASLLHLAEVCGLAADLCRKTGRDPANLDPIDLQIHLVSKGTMISFFNDFDLAEPELWKEAALFFGNRGFFADYDSRPDEPLDARIALLWKEAFRAMLSGQSEAPHELAFQVHEIDQGERIETLSRKHWHRLLEDQKPSLCGSDPILRKEALESLFSNLKASREFKITAQNPS